MQPSIPKLGDKNIKMGIHSNVVGEMFNMDKRVHQGSGITIQESASLFAAFSNASAIGLALCDKQLRYQAINTALAAMNGIPARTHLGNSVYDILGDVAAEVEPLLRRVFVSGQAVLLYDLKATLPTRTKPGYWIRNYFPIKDAGGRVQQVGTLIVEVTAQRKLEEFFREPASELRHTKTMESWWLSWELHNSVKQYHATLATSLDRLIQQPEKSGEPYAQSIELLNQRIVTLQTLASVAACRFPIDNSKGDFLNT
jgi:transcriptional regulator with PAS, ATPase and Fis domain